MDNMVNVLDKTYRSTSWLLSPFQFVIRKVLFVKVTLKAIPFSLRYCGGMVGLTRYGINVLRSEGLAGIKRRILFSAPTSYSYADWLRQYDTLSDAERNRIRNRIALLQNLPCISVVMAVGNPPLTMLEQTVRSVQKQLYTHWELCMAADAVKTDPAVRRFLQNLADADARIKVAFVAADGLISKTGNSALELVAGSHIALLNQDTLLPEQALFWIADAITAHPQAGMIYADEDKIDKSGMRCDPYFKPDWNPDLFLTHNMIGYPGVYRTDLVRKLHGFREDYEGGHDYDLALRCSERLESGQIVHISRVLCHQSAQTKNEEAKAERQRAFDSGKRALNDYLHRNNVPAKAEHSGSGKYRIRYRMTSEPLVSLILPTRNALALTKNCIDSIVSKTTYRNFEILLIDNNSDDAAALEYFAGLENNRQIRVIRDERPFNYSALNNAAASIAKGEYLCLINNDIEVISPGWLEEMLSLAMQPGVGAVGAKLWYPDNTLQHAGVILGLGGVAGHSQKLLKKGEAGYFLRTHLTQSLSAVTAACMVVSKRIYQETGGLDEVNLSVAFNDVDFCLRAIQAGYRNVWTPYAELYHHESATRGQEDSLEKQKRFKEEILYMQKRWETQLESDPAYNPNLTLWREDFSLAWPPRIPPI